MPGFKAIASSICILASSSASAYLAGCHILNSAFVAEQVKAIETIEQLAVVVETVAQVQPRDILFHQSNRIEWETQIGRAYQELPAAWVANEIWLSQGGEYFGKKQPGYSTYNFRLEKGWRFVQLSDISTEPGKPYFGSLFAKWMELIGQERPSENLYNSEMQRMLQSFGAPTHSRFYQDLRIAGFAGNDSNARSEVVFIVTTPEAMKVRLHRKMSGS